jgi:hypothetical protein
VSAGDTVHVLLTRAGKEPGQGVGYLDDGTMLVVERARDRVGREVAAVVTSVLTTANGRMVFARRVDAEQPRPPAEQSLSTGEQPRTSGDRPRPSADRPHPSAVVPEPR